MKQVNSPVNKAPIKTPGPARRNDCINAPTKYNTKVIKKLN
jgi:hypothetical protein